MALRNHRGVTGGAKGSNTRGIRGSARRVSPTVKAAAIPAPSPATLEHARAVAGAITRLWRALDGTSNAIPPEPREHSYRVGLFSWNIARLMGLSEERAVRIFHAAYLHDVGSAAVPGSIMLKPGRLTANERGAMQVHPLMSRELLAAFLPTRDLAGIALSHHERMDGDGYPNGLPGAKIPLEARVLAIGDSLDAMISRRPYRAPLSFRRALEEIKSGAGRQFDANIVEVLARAGESISWSPGAPSRSR